jgi:hypothetical protein
MENNNSNLIMCFYFFLFAHLLMNISNSSSSSKWDYQERGQDWPENCKTAEQAPIDISKPFEFKSKYLFF